MKQLLLVAVFVSSLSVCHAQILKIDFTCSSTLGRMAWNDYKAVPAAPWDSVGGAISGTIIYNADPSLFQEEFSQNAPYWKWQYQTQQQLSLNASIGVLSCNIADFPYGTLTSYTEFKPVVLGQKTTTLWSNIFDVTFDNQSQHSGLVSTIKASFGHYVYSSMQPTEPLQPLISFYPDFYTGSLNYKYGIFEFGNALYSETGQLIGSFCDMYSIDTCQVAVIPEPATLLLVGIGALMMRRKN
jgi:hypothetical protein